MNIVGFSLIAMSLAGCVVSFVLIILAVLRLTNPAQRVRGVVGLAAGTLGGVFILALRLGVGLLVRSPSNPPHETAFEMPFIFLAIGFAPAALAAEVAFLLKARLPRPRP